MTRSWVPFGGIALTATVALLGVGLNAVVPEQAFEIVLNVSSLCLIIAWAAIVLCQLRLWQWSQQGKMERPSFPIIRPRTCHVHVHVYTAGSRWNDARSPGETVATVERELRDLLDTIATTVPAFRNELSPGMHREPFEADPGSTIVQTVMKQGQAILGHRPVERAEVYWTDAALLSQTGIPSLLIGVDGGGAHADTEWATIASLHQLTDILTATIGEFCA